MAIDAKEKTQELMRIIGDLLQPHEQAAAEQKAAPVQPDVRRRIAEALSHKDSVQAGHVQIIGLDTLREKLGDSWPEKRDVVHDVLHSIITRRLSPQDVFFQKSDAEYVIVFSRLGAEAAHFVCAHILRELNVHFLGSGNMDGITVKTAVGVIDGKLVYEAKSLEDMLSKVSNVTSDMADAARYTSNVAREVAESGNQPSARSAAAAWAKLLPRGLSPTYRAMWDAKREVLSTYTIDYQLTRGHAVVPAFQALRDEKTIRAMDMALLATAVAELEEMFANSFRLMICVPVHYETVMTPALLRDYIAACAEIPEALRKYILFACDQFPEGVPLHKLSLIAHGLRPYCRAVAANVNIDYRDFRTFADAGLKVTGCYLPKAGKASHQLREKLRAFIAAAHKAGLSCAFLNVDSVDSAAVVKAVGGDFIHGKAIQSPGSVPGHMIRKSWAEIAGQNQA